jgi:hypothetical protein
MTVSVCWAASSISARCMATSNGVSPSISAPGANKMRVPCKTLADLLLDEGVTRVDGMKIDVEGMEDVILTPFFQSADPSLFPGFIVIEDSAYRWASNLLAVLEQAGYRRHASHRMNLILVLPPAN